MSVLLCLFKYIFLFIPVTLDVLAFIFIALHNTQKIGFGQKIMVMSRHQDILAFHRFTSRSRMKLSSLHLPFIDLDILYFHRDILKIRGNLPHSRIIFFPSRSLVIILSELWLLV